ncbi:MAG: hypothetical protein II873_04865 [Oscillospiraceae bacterium]|nr:hypothetical protein [Oscillospiraceae bacterium]
MSVMSETAVTLSDLITMGYKMIASTREALNDLEAFFYLLERRSGQKGEREPLQDPSAVPPELKKEDGDEPEQPERQEAPTREPEPVHVVTTVEVRQRMAALKSMGYREEMRDMIVKRGATALTQLTDPAVLAELDAEVEEFIRKNGIELNMPEEKS